MSNSQASLYDQYIDDRPIDTMFMNISGKYFVKSSFKFIAKWVLANHSRIHWTYSYLHAVMVNNHQSHFTDFLINCKV
jgi:hypothetical protein